MCPSVPAHTQHRAPADLHGSATALHALHVPGKAADAGVSSSRHPSPTVGTPSPVSFTCREGTRRTGLSPFCPGSGCQQVAQVFYLKTVSFASYLSVLLPQCSPLCLVNSYTPNKTPTPHSCFWDSVLLPPGFSYPLSGPQDTLGMPHLLATLSLALAHRSRPVRMGSRRPGHQLGGSLLCSFSHRLLITHLSPARECVQIVRGSGGWGSAPCAHPRTLSAGSFVRGGGT